MEAYMKLHKMFLLTFVCVVFFSLTTHSIASPEGRYKYVEYGKDVFGELVLFSAEELGSIVKIKTVSTDGYTCEFAGLCNFREEKIVCVNADVLEDSSWFIEIHQLGNTLEITHTYSGVCGLHGAIKGKYIKK